MAAFFVASLVHIRIGPTSVHLLLNGLAGVLLGLRAGPSIAVGLTLQAVLIGHGGFSALGVNICVMTIPALFAGLVVGCGPKAPPVSAEESKAIAKDMRKSHEQLKALINASNSATPDMKKSHQELQRSIK